MAGTFAGNPLVVITRSSSRAGNLSPEWWYTRRAGG
jgi:hypothetical protein